MPITDPAPLSSEKIGSCGRFLNISAFRRTAMPDKTICDTFYQNCQKHVINLKKSPLAPLNQC